MMYKIMPKMKYLLCLLYIFSFSNLFSESLSQFQKRTLYPNQISVMSVPLDSKSDYQLMFLRSINGYIQIGLDYSGLKGTRGIDSENGLIRGLLDVPSSFYRVSFGNRTFQYESISIASHLFPVKDYPIYLGIYLGTDILKNRIQHVEVSFDKNLKDNYFFGERISAISKSNILGVSIGTKWLFENSLLIGAEVGLKYNRIFYNDKKVGTLFYSYREITSLDIYNSFSTIENELYNRPTNGLGANASLLLKLYFGISF